MNHPLTDEIIDEIAQFNPDLTGEQVINRDHDMRVAYDKGCNDQLEKVIEWLEDCSIYDTIVYRGESVLVEELRKAMRPQENQ